MRCACSARGGDEIKKFPRGFCFFWNIKQRALMPSEKPCYPSDALSPSLMRALTFTAAVFGSTRGDMAAAEASPREFGRVFVCAFMALVTDLEY
jgi:hypothetical protein